MSRRILTALAVLVVLLLMVIAFSVRSGGPAPSAEQRIMLAIADAEEAAERGSVSGLMRIVSDDYADQAGYDRQAVSRLVVSALRSGEQWRISTELDSITVQEDSAETRLKVTLWGLGPQGDRSVYHLSLVWRKEGRHWRVVNSYGWQQGPDAGFDPTMPPSVPF